MGIEVIVKTSGGGSGLSGGTVTSFTPSWTNVTVGNATQDFEWTRLGPFMLIKGCFTWGGSTAFTGDISMAVPDSKTCTRLTNQIVEGFAHANDDNASANSTILSAGVTGAGAIAFLPNATNQFVNASNPFVWQSLDRLAISLMITIDEWS